MSPLEWGLLVALSILWGGSFFFNGVAIRELPTLTVVAGRVILGAVTLLVVMRVMGLRMPSGRPVWLAFFSMGFLNNVLPFSLIVWGQIHIASGIASILNATTPLFTVIVAHLLTSDEKISKSSLLGIGFGFAGVVMMIGGDAFRGWGVDILAPVAILGAALSYAFAGVFGRRFKAMGVSPMATATGQITASSVMLVPLVMMVDQPWTLPLPSLPVWGALVGLALLCSLPPWPISSTFEFLRALVRPTCYLLLFLFRSVRLYWVSGFWGRYCYRSSC